MKVLEMGKINENANDENQKKMRLSIKDENGRCNAVKTTFSLDDAKSSRDVDLSKNRNVVIPFVYVSKFNSKDDVVDGAYHLLGEDVLVDSLGGFFGKGNQLVVISVDELAQVIDGLHASLYQVIGFMKAFGIPEERIWSMMEAVKEFLVDLASRVRPVEIFLRDGKLIIEETNPLFVLETRTERDWVGTDDWL